MRKALMLTDMSGSDAVYCALKAEGSGKIESVWVPEMTRRDSISILGAIAASTKKIRVAPGILNVYSRTPALIAMSLVTLQELSNGRLCAGLSVGNPDYVHDIHGLKVKDSIERLREVISIVRKTAAGEANVSFKGRVFEIKSWSPKFPKIDPFPIYVGAHNPGLLQFVGEACDGVILNLVSPENIGSAATIIRQAASNSGRPSNAVDISSIMMVAINNSDAHAAEQRVRKQIAFYLSRSRQIRKRFSKSAFAGEITKVEELMAKGKQNEIAPGLSQELVDSISVYGTRGDVEERVADYEKAGLDLAILYVAGWMEDSRSFTDSLLGSI